MLRSNGNQALNLNTALFSLQFYSFTFDHILDRVEGVQPEDDEGERRGDDAPSEEDKGNQIMIQQL